MYIYQTKYPINQYFLFIDVVKATQDQIKHGYQTHIQILSDKSGCDRDFEVSEQHRFESDSKTIQKEILSEVITLPI